MHTMTVISTTELSPAETARVLGVTLDYVYKLLWSGRLPGRKVEGRWRVSPAAVESRFTKQAELGALASRSPSDLGRRARGRK
jgi:excisionase family DNA binding protein